MTKFRSTTGKTEHVALESGHTAQVPTEGVELDSRFHQVAIMQGCLPVNAEHYEAPEPGGGLDRDQAVYDALHRMLESSDDKAFTRNGTPNLSILANECGFKPERGEVEQAWAAVQDDLDDGE